MNSSPSMHPRFDTRLSGCSLRRPLILAAASLAGASALAQSTQRVSLSSSGAEGNNWSGGTSVSEDGRYVAFVSAANNLLAGGTNGFKHVFVRDRQTGATEIVSIDSSGNQGDHDSGSVSPYFYGVSISGDGRYVAFESLANNLVPGNTNDWEDVFVHDRQTGVTEQVSVDSAEIPGEGDSLTPAISADGRWVAFASGADNLVGGGNGGQWQTYVRDRQTGLTEVVSVDSLGNLGNGQSAFPSISGDGRYVAFDSLATSLVPNDTNGDFDAFVHDRQTGSTEIVSIDSSGNHGTGASGDVSISGDGRWVAFISDATNLVPGDFNGAWDAFVHDRQTGATSRVSVSSLASQGNGDSDNPSLSTDGRWVAFDSFATNLVPGDTNGVRDVFIHSLETDDTYAVNSLSAAGGSSDAGLSGNGRYVAFESDASNLVSNDFNGVKDAFIRDRLWTETYTWYCTGGTSASGCSSRLVASGVASATYTTGFTVTAEGGEGQKDGLFFYGQNGQQAAPWGNGTSFQCVVAPVKRGGLLGGNGTGGDCDAVVAQDLNARWCPICPKPSHAPTPGRPLQVQFWYRDPLNTSNQSTSLSNAIEVEVVP